MKKNAMYAFGVVMLAGLLMLPGCKTAETWSPLGSWTLNIATPDWGRSWTNTLSFTGNEDGGSVTGLTADDLSGPQTGTWTKTADYAITMNFSFVLFGIWTETVLMTGSSSEANPNSMSGTGTWTEVGSSTSSIVWSATRL